MCNCMPPIRRTTGRSSGVPSDRSGRSPKRKFVWQAQEQVYVCPQGHRLTRISQETRERAEGRTVEVCEDLSLSQGALSAVPAGTAVHQQRKGRTIKRNEHEDLIVAHPGEDADARGQGDLPQAGPDGGTAVRGCQGHRGLRRFSGRGLERVRIEVGLCVLAPQSLSCPGRRPAKNRRWTKWNTLPGRSLKAGRSLIGQGTA